MTTRKQSDERLLKLAWLLENLPAEIPKMKFPKPSKNITFNLREWFSCGTAACAVGFAACHPWFNERELRLSYNNNPMYDNMYNFSAAALFFGAQYGEARYLFAPQDYKRGNRRDVAKRIRAFVRNR